MPVPTAEQIKKRESSLKKTLAEQGESMEPAKRRLAKKKLKRVQRKRREMTLQAARRATKLKPADASAESQEAKSE